MFAKRAVGQKLVFGKIIYGCVALLIATLVLSGCSAGPAKVVTPTPVPQARTTGGPVPTITPLPPLPSATPRPTLPPAPNINAAKSGVLKSSFDALLSGYYFPLNSSDVYEVALNGIKKTLTDAGIKNPQVQIPQFSNDTGKDWQSFLQAYLLVLDKYKGQVPEENLAYGAIQAEVSTLAECRTSFYKPGEADDFLQSITGTAPTVGLGIVVTPVNGGEGLYITRVIPGSPADKAGLKLGDSIRGIDGQNIVGIELAKAYRLLLGGDKATPGTNISLQVTRAGSGQNQTLQITRGSTTIPPFETQVLGNVGYLRINGFPNRAQSLLNDLSTQFDAVLNDLVKQNVKGIVLDVRGESFGNYRTVQSFLSRFVKTNALLVMVGQDQGKSNLFELPSLSNVTKISKPLAVLVDSSTLGEPEMFALGLQQNKAARVFGLATGGCLVGSDVVKLPDNSLLNLAKFRVIADPNQPDSFVSQVVPDEQVAQDSQQLGQGKDAVLEKALAYIRSL